MHPPKPGTPHSEPLRPLLFWYVDVPKSPGTFLLLGSGRGKWWSHRRYAMMKRKGRKNHIICPKFQNIWSPRPGCTMWCVFVMGRGQVGGRSFCKRVGGVLLTSIYFITQPKLVWVIWFGIIQIRSHIIMLFQLLLPQIISYTFLCTIPILLYQNLELIDEK